MSLDSKGVRGGVITIASQGLKMLIQVLGLVVLSRLLDPNDFGLIAIITAVIAFGDLFRDFGLTHAAVQADRLSAGEKSNLFWINTGIGIALALGISLASGLLAQVFDEPRLQLLLIVVSSIYVLNGVSAQFRVQLIRDLRFQALAITDVMAHFTGLLSAFVLAMAGAGYWALAFQQIFSTAMLLLIPAALSGWRPGKPRREISVRKFLTYGRDLALAQMLGYAAGNVDSVVIGMRLGTVALGYYNRAFQLLTVPVNQLLAPLTNVVLPILSRFSPQDAKYMRYVTAIHVCVAYAAAAVFPLIIVAAHPIVAIVLGPGWEGTSAILQILSIGGLFQVMSYVGYWIFLSTASTSSLLRYNIITKGVTVGAVIVGSNWGIEGIAIGYSASLVASWPFLIYWLQKLLGVSFRKVAITGLRAIVLSTLIVIFGFVCTTSFSLHGVAMILVSILIVLCVFIVATLVPSVREEYKSIRTILMRTRANA